MLTRWDWYVNSILHCVLNYALYYWFLCILSCWSSPYYAPQVFLCFDKPKGALVIKILIPELAKFLGVYKAVIMVAFFLKNTQCYYNVHFLRKKYAMPKQCPVNIVLSTSQSSIDCVRQRSALNINILLWIIWWYKWYNNVNNMVIYINT